MLNIEHKRHKLTVPPLTFALAQSQETVCHTASNRESCRQEKETKEKVWSTNVRLGHRNRSARRRTTLRKCPIGKSKVNQAKLRSEGWKWCLSVLRTLSSVSLPYLTSLCAQSYVSIGRAHSPPHHHHHLGDPISKFKPLAAVLLPLSLSRVWPALLSLGNSFGPAAACLDLWPSFGRSGDTVSR